MERAQVEKHAAAAVEATALENNPVIQASHPPALVAKPEPFLVARGLLSETPDIEPAVKMNIPERTHGELTDLGWNDHPASVPEPLVKGMSNDEMWTLVRRFNKVRFFFFFLFRNCGGAYGGSVATVPRPGDSTAPPRPS